LEKINPINLLAGAVSTKVCIPAYDHPYTNSLANGIFQTPVVSYPIWGFNP